jgi:hypothetical protein
MSNENPWIAFMNKYRADRPKEKLTNKAIAAVYRQTHVVKRKKKTSSFKRTRKASPARKKKASPAASPRGKKLSKKGSKVPLSPARRRTAGCGEKYE